MSEGSFLYAAFILMRPGPKPWCVNPWVAELKAVRIFFKEPVKTETRCLAAHTTSGAIILKHETPASIFHVRRFRFWREAV